MRRSTLFSALVGTAAMIAMVFGNAATANASTAHYVALGDSYSSGVGAGSYDLSASCERSSAAYPALYKAATSPSSFTFVACSGAKASDIESSQLSALSTSTTLVSVTDGGNDAGFSTVAQDCVLDDDSGCQTAINTAESYVHNTLPGVLNTLYSDIRSHAPSAKVVVLGYPEFYDLNFPVSCFDLDQPKRTALDNAADVLDSAIASAVAAHSNFSFADVRSQFSGHELCDPSPWLHSVDITNLGDSYHPTAAGHSQGYLPVFESAA